MRLAFKLVRGLFLIVGVILVSYMVSTPGNQYIHAVLGCLLLAMYDGMVPE